MNTIQNKVVNKSKEVKTNEKSKKDFLDFLEKNKKNLDTGFGAFHHNKHGNW